jgi:urease accessory protein UreF
VLIVSAALVAGLVLGSVGIASAATTATTGTPRAGFGAQVGGMLRQAGVSLADIVAKLTGQTAAQVYTQRAAGKSFADIASAKGVSADKVTADALAARKTALAAAVKAGTLTQAQADTMLARMQTRIPQRITDPAPAGCDGTGSGAGRGGMGRGAGGGGGGGCGLATGK